MSTEPSNEDLQALADQVNEAFAEADVRLVTLSCYDAVIRQALATGYISADDEALLKEWRKDPAAWTGKK